jgi:hypothetical protein
MSNSALETPSRTRTASKTALGHPSQVMPSFLTIPAALT